MKLSVLTLITAVLVGGCAFNPELVQPMTKRGLPVAQLHPVMETVPVASGDDAADDPAIWVHPQVVAQSRILGTDKDAGLVVYSLQGEQLQFIPAGQVNNVDLRQSISVQGQTLDLAAATNRTHIGLDLFSIDMASGGVSLLGSWPLELVEPYGLCMYRDAQNRPQIFVNSTDGRYQQWLVTSVAPLQLELLREFQVDTQPEGCAVDDAQHQLFVGEEGRGVWRVSTDPAATELHLVDAVGDGVLVADVEGLDIYRTSSGRAWLVVSSQGDFSYAVYAAQGDYAYLGSFQIVADAERGIDGSQETDGLTLSSANLGPGLEAGVLVVQDGYNRLPRDNQNFKLVPWSAIAEALNLD